MLVFFCSFIFVFPSHISGCRIHSNFGKTFPLTLFVVVYNWIISFLPKQPPLPVHQLWLGVTYFANINAFEILPCTSFINAHCTRSAEEKLVDLILRISCVKYNLLMPVAWHFRAALFSSTIIDTGTAAISNNHMFFPSAQTNLHYREPDLHDCHVQAEY